MFLGRCHMKMLRLCAGKSKGVVITLSEDFGVDHVADIESGGARWRRFFEVNVMSGVRLSRHYLGPMKQKNWGRIVFISSESALQILPEMIHYGMTKTAQLAISRGLARPRPERPSLWTRCYRDRPSPRVSSDL
jgi:NAD(P)-dependent dehydrogenase (short-subunit alcohol dehydrogenase family)